MLNYESNLWNPNTENVDNNTQHGLIFLELQQSRHGQSMDFPGFD